MGLFKTTTTTTSSSSQNTAEYEKLTDANNDDGEEDDALAPVSATEDELPNRLSGVERRIAAEELRYRDNLWRSNYHEAAIFIEEGMNNDKFENHPQKRIIHSNDKPKQNDQSNDVNNGHNNEQHSTHYGSTSTSGESSVIALTSPELATKLRTQPVNNDLSPTCDDVTSAGINGNYENMIITSPKKPHKQSSQTNYNLLGGQFTTIETYILVHNRYFYQLDLLASLVLIALALFEPPAVPGLEMNTAIHAAVEMFALAIIAMELILKFRWMGPKRFFHHARTVTKILVLSIMIIEAITMASRQVRHARYSRALRPIFLIDNHYCNGIRRVVRQIFQAIPAIFDMFILAIFFLFVFSIFGFYLLAPHNNYFSDMVSTVGNLLILATTANMPDIILPSYAVSRWSAIYFVLFIILHLFLLTNLTMAAVYESFTRREKEKFHKLFLHRRKACQEAFKLLVSRKDPNHIYHRQFMGLMRYLNREYTMFEAYLIFKALDTDKSGSLSLDEFYQIYDFLKLDWRLIYPQVHWYDHCDKMPIWIKRIIAKLNRCLKYRYFEWTIDSLIGLTALVQFLEATAFDFHKVLRVVGGYNAGANINQTLQANNITNFNVTDITSPIILNNITNATASTYLVSLPEEPSPDSISTGIFISIFAIEAAWRLIALGVTDYWASSWNRFDLTVLILSGSGFISGLVGGPAFEWVIVLRVLRLVRRFEFKRRYKDLWQTLTYILLKRFVSMVCVVMILYYFFAIIGMELMSQYTLKDCCKNTTNEVSFKFKPQNSQVISSLYYLNDFTDLINSYLTLFGMTGSTYWLAVMNAYAIVAKNEWLRIYFGLYYLCSIIVMNIVIAFILESFLFRIQYRNKMGDKCDDANLFTVTVSLSSSEVNFLYNNLKPSRGDKNFDLMARAVKTMNDNGQFATTTKNLEIGQRHQQCDHGESISSVNSAISSSQTNGSKQKRNKKLRDQELSPLLSAEDQHHNSQQQLQQQQIASGIEQKRKGLKKVATVESIQDYPTCSESSIDLNKQKNQQHQASGYYPKRPKQQRPLDGCFGNRSYFIYQAEQTRNKFSFTLKMYADEVVSWLKEAEKADMNAVDLMISRNQVRAEQVALARLLRRNLASNLEEQMAQLEFAKGNEGNIGTTTRSRSYSSSGNPRGSNREQQQQQQQKKSLDPTISQKQHQQGSYIKDHSSQSTHHDTTYSAGDHSKTAHSKVGRHKENPI